MIDRLAWLARVTWGTAVAAIGGDILVLRDFLPELFPVPAWLPARGVLACGLGAALLGLGLAVVADRRTHSAARAIAGVLGVAFVVLHVPLIVTHPRAGGEWTCAFEVLAIATGGAVLAGRPDFGRSVYAASLPVFGVLHFVFCAYVASVIPAWLPGHVFWAYATGILHIAAGLALLFAIRARRAAILTGAMFASWVVMLHLPRVLAALDQRAEWTSLFVALAMAGGAWLIAERAPS